MKRKNNNKGAALIAVLIGITFIAILSCSLLYMSTLNSKMKSMRQFASDNFYSAEYALNDMMAQLKQYVSVQADPRTFLRGYLKDGNSFNVTNLQNLIEIDKFHTGGVEGLQSVTVSKFYTDASIATYVEDATYITLKGVQITTKTDPDHGNYESNVVTDIRFGFPASTDAPGRLSDFSILSDSPLWIEKSSQYFGGDIYLRKNGTIGNDALRVGSGENWATAQITFLGNFIFLDGDLTVCTDSSIYLGGTTYVNGKISTSGTGQVIVGGTCYVKDGYPSGQVVTTGAGEIKTSGVEWANYDDYSDGLGNMLMAPTMHLYSGGVDHSYTQEQFNTMCHNGGLNSDAFVTGTIGGVTASAGYFTNSTYGGGMNLVNTLIIAGTAPDTFQGTLTDCTLINIDKTGCVKIAIDAGGFPWGTMSDEGFDVARQLLVNGKSDTPHVEFKGNGNSVKDMVASGSNFTLGGYTLVPYNTDTLGKPYYYRYEDPTYNYFAFDNFLSVDMEKTLREFKGAAGGSASASAQPAIALLNWSKE